MYCRLDIYMFFCFFKQKTAYEMRISDWSSDVCSSDLAQLSANSSFQALVSRFGDCPQNTLTGMICAFSTALCSSAPTSRTSVGGATRRVRRPNQQIGRASCRERVCQYV